MDEGKGFLERWILPTDDLYDGHPELEKKFGGAPLGNSPEFNTWSLWLNNDVHICHDNHLIITKDFPEYHELKFYGSDTKEISWSYRVG